ncbi:hypothetical protein [Azospirillum griseum]|uniref:hypothetical protein n=1 Tax=Azospirillum griseum TaxID=2496639 RepID=UPI001AECDBEE|nr:hypothetical protein [Azospirillum griseum]
MSRIIPILSLSLPLALVAGVAMGQSVADYKTALETATATDAAGCRTLSTYVFTAIPDGQRADWLLPLVTLDGKEDPVVAQKRLACLEARKQAVVAFDGGTGEQIVTPAEAYKDTTDQPYYRDPATPMPEAGVVPHGNRALRRVGTP